MLRFSYTGCIILAGLLWCALAHADPAPIRLPPGSHAAAAGGFVSGRGLRDTSDYLARELAKDGIAVQQIGPYRVRGAELTRFVSASERTRWLAIHVLRQAGKTLIFFVPRSST
ncbi:MAG TPA: hypothetical protein VFY79_03205 [Dehalococcoidia bacterium]|nr:hypothetical protein [Dehalococcoidia bacterium]